MKRGYSVFCFCIRILFGGYFQVILKKKKCKRRIKNEKDYVDSITFITVYIRIQ